MKFSKALLSILFASLSVLYGHSASSALEAVATRPQAERPVGDTLSRFNVVWDSPSKNSHDSMPLGNGDVGINAWIEPSGDLVFYVSKTDAWDENGRLCKIGRVRVKFAPPLPVAQAFRQELKLGEGTIEAVCGKTKLLLWVDANRPVVHVQAESETPCGCRAEVELWRRHKRPFGADDDSYSGAGLSHAASALAVLPDVVSEADPTRVVWYHRNTESIYPLCLKTQHLESLKDRFPDPLLNWTFGAGLGGPHFVRDGKQALKSDQPATRHELLVTVLAARTDTAETWRNRLEEMQRTIGKIPAAGSRQTHENWWRTFWDRSWVDVEGADVLTRGYVLQRFMNACSGRGGSPIKFNGSIFTVEASPGAPPDTPAGDPDWRRWGGNYWFQNTRLAYWPMFAAGDCEMMEPWFHMYRDALPLSLARIKSYYGFDNAAQFPETMYRFGLPNNGDYGWNNAAPEPANTYIRRYWNGSLELIAAMLDRYDYTQDEQFARQTLVPLADPLINFLDRYWSRRDARGKMRLEPAQSLETWHVAVNPMPEIAALHYLLPRLLALPDGTTAPHQRARWKKVFAELPPVPVAEVNGVRLLRPAESFSAQSNSENTELYAVFPYRLYGVGRPGLDMARATYQRRTNHHNRGWCQDSIQAACLGLGEEAGRLVSARAAQVNRGYRFPVMWGPNFDWIPDQDHGNNILTTLQFMLLQADGDKIYVLPAWPKEWNVSFKLHAPKNTVVRGVYRGGKVEQLDVTPAARRADVTIMINK